MASLLERLSQSRKALEILTVTPARRTPGENREYVRALFPMLAEARRKGHGFVKIAETLGRHGVSISRQVLERHYRGWKRHRGSPRTPTALSRGRRTGCMSRRKTAPNGR